MQSQHYYCTRLSDILTKTDIAMNTLIIGEMSVLNGII